MLREAQSALIKYGCCLEAFFEFWDLIYTDLPNRSIVYKCSTIRTWFVDMANLSVVDVDNTVIE